MNSMQTDAVPMAADEGDRPLRERLQQLEKRLDAIELSLPSLASFSEAVIRLADHLVPAPTNIVGSRYVADRLGCTTTWVSKMAFQGTIPRSCVVQGTGRGRLWKFHRKHVDEWLKSRGNQS
jgi:hypothetical protein